MTILDRARGAHLVRIDTAQFADALARHLPDTIDADSDTRAAAIHDAAATARGRLDRATEFARDIGRDLAKAGGDLHLDDRMDEVAQRIRGVSSTPALRTLVARLERELPETDRDRYDRAYARGRAQARSAYLAVGLAAGIGAGLVAVVLLDPKRGKARRERLMAKTSSLTEGLTQKVAATVKDASGRARGIAIERGLVKPASDEPVPQDAAEPVVEQAAAVADDVVPDLVPVGPGAPAAVEEAAPAG